MGFTEIILALLAVSGMGVQKNPNAPSAAEVMKYAPDAADAMFYLDVEAVVPSNYKILTGLPDDPTIKSSPALREAIVEMVEKLEQGRQMVKQASGVDLVTDLKTFTGFLVIPGKGDPQFVIVARGNFPPDLVARMAQFEKDARSEKVGNTTILIDNDGAIGQAADGTAFFGSPALVKQRVQKWKTPKARKGGLVEQASKLIDEKPFLLVASRPGASALKHAEGHHGNDPDAAFLLDAYTGHDFAAVWLSWNGVGWTYRAKSAVGYARAAMASDGLLKLMRASHLLTRGAVELVLAALDSYANDPTVAAIVKHKDDILKLVEAWTGDGSFAAKEDKQPKQKTVTVRATGAKLSDVLSAGAIAVPAVLFLMGSRKSEAVPAEKKPAERKP